MPVEAAQGGPAAGSADAEGQRERRAQEDKRRRHHREEEEAGEVEPERVIAVGGQWRCERDERQSDPGHERHHLPARVGSTQPERPPVGGEVGSQGRQPGEPPPGRHRPVPDYVKEAGRRIHSLPRLECLVGAPFHATAGRRAGTGPNGRAGRRASWDCCHPGGQSTPLARAAAQASIGRPGDAV